MRVVAIIPARGGSKGIPDKNLASFCGRPLLSWTIAQALNSKRVSEVYVSSDSEQILKCAEESGAKCIQRPASLSTDESTSEEALRHALGVIGGDIDVVVFLQATSPLRSAEDIDSALSLFDVEGAESLFSVSVMDDLCVWRGAGASLKCLTYDPENRGMRQTREPLLLENGSIYIFKPEVLVEYNNRIGGRIITYPMEKWQAYEIDTFDDLRLCEYLFDAHGLVSEPCVAPGDIDLIVYDFDGVMTNNCSHLTEEGKEMVIVNRSDGLAISRIRDKGIKQIILSSEKNPVVGARARKLGIDCMSGVGSKLSVLQEHCDGVGVKLERVLFVGNDINDKEVMEAVGYAYCPNDAHEDVKKIAQYKFRSSGGQGVVRELLSVLGRGIDD